MITVRKSNDRGVGRHGWLTSHHTFSFANYYDPKQMGFRTLRVINEDHVASGRGFGAHRHEDMEIISIVLEGALAHRDSTGGEGVLRRGEVQRMSAGSGVVHSEFNGSETEPVHFFQIWIEPSAEGITPGYEQKLFPDEERRNRLRIIAAPGAPEGAVDIHQDARVYASLLDAGSSVDYTIATGRGAWIQLASGSIDVNGTTVNAGDGVAIEDETKLTISAKENAEFLLFDLG